MKKILSPSDLNRVRKAAKEEIELRQGPKDVRVTVHMGTCGIAAGARDIIATILQELSAAKVDSVTLQQAGCIGLCDQEPMISITNKAGEVCRYGRLDKNKTRDIVRNHILRGTVVNEHLIKDKGGKGE
ncbi:MAG: (2Fe-2S) ferredoxin domain-containing protein [Candidatus Riflebacteria bacterium]|nr:(2Fe-2S) ferredoxin domain-containing protein [Candidatus Riflebacteria bacterium]